jgi:hypothetical protein
MKYSLMSACLLLLLVIGCKDSVSESQPYPALVYIGVSEAEPAFHEFELRNQSTVAYYYFVVMDSVVVYEMMVKEGVGWTTYPTYFGDMPAALYTLAGKKNLRFQVFPPRGNIPYRIAVGLYGADQSLRMKLWSDPVEE